MFTRKISTVKRSNLIYKWEDIFIIKKEEEAIFLKNFLSLFLFFSLYFIFTL